MHRNNWPTGNLVPAKSTPVPTTDSNDNNSFASLFNNRSHFRLEGLETFLQGVVPRAEATSDGVAQVNIDILSLGVYADIQDGKIFHFISLPRQVRLTYEIDESGAIGDTLVHATYPTSEHAEPTPFTQWTIRLLNRDGLDLTKLTEVQLHRKEVRDLLGICLLQAVVVHDVRWCWVVIPYRSTLRE